LEKIHSANDRIAAANRAILDGAGAYSLNFMASPGAGKTSLVEQTVTRLKGHARVGMINGDIATSLDAERAQNAGAAAVQINTGGDCHLDAVMLSSALNELDLTRIDLLIVENVGNLICPANWVLGTHKNVLIASVPEGADKPYKYPGIYRGVDVLIINKIDLLPYVPFDMEYFKRGVEILNPGVQTFALSCRTGEGIDAWIDWLTEQIATV